MHLLFSRYIGIAIFNRDEEQQSSRAIHLLHYLCSMQNISTSVRTTLNSMGISQLTHMQEEAIKVCLAPGDVILLSPTGSGKTLGFLLPLLQVMNPATSGVQALILAPSRELSLQIEQVFRKISTGFKVTCCYGGHAIKTEINSLIEPPALLIGTPGRIVDHLRRNSFSTAKITTLVLDEFDKSLELGFQEDMATIIGQLPQLNKRILTSATQSDDIPAFTGIHNPVTLNFLEKESSPALTTMQVSATGKDKFDALFRLICKLGNAPTLVFCNHREAVDRICDLLNERGVASDAFHGGMEQEDRERALIKFRNGSHNLLITTDLASRGLDIPEIQNIIHHQLPHNEEAFIHRNGRTARMHANGSAYLILSEEEYLPSFVDPNIEMFDISGDTSLPDLPEWVTLYISAGKKDKINKIDIVGLLLQKGGLNKEELGRIEVLDYMSFAAINRGKAIKTVELLRNQPIKRKKVKIDISY